MNKLSEAIEQAVTECIETGNGCKRIYDPINRNTLLIRAEWISVDDFNVVEVYISVNGGIVLMAYALDETKTR